MKRAEIVRILSVGGEAAIVAELVVVIAVFFYALVLPEFLDIYLTRDNSLETFQQLIELYNENRILFSGGMGLFILFPTVAMIIVVWAWFLYFASEGVGLVNWVAVTFALIGIIMMALSFALNVWGMSIMADALEQGEVSYDDIYIGYVLIITLHMLAIDALYVSYPLVLSLAARSKQLLPRWFIFVALTFGGLNEFNVLVRGEYSFLSDMLELMAVMWPFLMGVVMLRKAQELSQHFSTTS